MRGGFEMNFLSRRTQIVLAMLAVPALISSCGVLNSNAACSKMETASVVLKLKRLQVDMSYIMSNNPTVIRQEYRPLFMEYSTALREATGDFDPLDPNESEIDRTFAYMYLEATVLGDFDTYSSPIKYSDSLTGFDEAFTAAWNLCGYEIDAPPPE